MSGQTIRSFVWWKWRRWYYQLVPHKHEWAEEWWAIGHSTGHSVCAKCGRRWVELNPHEAIPLGWGTSDNDPVGPCSGCKRPLDDPFHTGVWQP